jgi:streptogramin lyase
VLYPVRVALLALVSAALFPACGASPPGDASPSQTPLSPFPSPTRGGAVALDPDALVAYAADADNRSLHAVDLASGEVATVPLGATPEQVILIGHDRLAVTLRDANEVLLLERDATGIPRPLASAAVPVEPFGLALSPRGELLVTSAWGNHLTSLHPETLERRWSLPLAREPRGVVVTPDGRRAFVTHLAGDAVTVVDLPERGAPAAPRRLPALGARYRNRVDSALGAGTLHPAAALAYAPVLSDDGARLFVPHLAEQNGADTARSIPGAYGGVPVEEETSVASVAVIAASSERLLGEPPPEAHPVAGAASIAAGASVGFAVAPRAAPSRHARAAALAGDALLVASLGTGELVELDARALDPAMSPRRVFRVGEGPTGVDADPDAGIAVVWSQLSHALSVVDLRSGEVETVEIAGDPLPPEVAAGRRLFLSERDRRISRDGRACASCHPDGRDDGLVWKLGAGPRQTPTLVGRLERGPYGWLGKHDRLEDNMQETMTRLGGAGLPEAELRSLAAFLRRGLRAPTRSGGDAQPPGPAAGGDPGRGRALFASADVGCSDCHRLEAEGSDRAVHRVGSRAAKDTTDGFRTPPLLFLGGTAPYFHDGRYATLEALLEDNLDRMGQTSQLSTAELQDLAAFLRTL